MIATHGKLLLAAFMSILIGIVLIQLIADDIEQVSVSSINVPNETITFSSVTGTAINESVTMTASDFAMTGSLANQLIAFTGIKNNSAEGRTITSFCNITVDAGVMSCNNSNSTTAFVNYTYISRRTGSLSQDDILSLTTLSNITSENIIGYCNLTAATGDLVCNNTRSNTAFATFDWEPDNVLQDGASRTILRTTMLFFAIAVLVLGIGFAIAAFKQSGVM